MAKSVTSVRLLSEVGSQSQAWTTEEKLNAVVSKKANAVVPLIVDAMKKDDPRTSSEGNEGQILPIL